MPMPLDVAQATVMNLTLQPLKLFIGEERHFCIQSAFFLSFSQYYSIEIFLPCFYCTERIRGQGWLL